MTRHHTDDADAIIESADSFVADVKRQMENYAAEEILNTDQVGLELELHSTRALSHDGENVTVARVRSKHATTHSYTVQPMISLAGKLVGPHPQDAVFSIRYQKQIISCLKCGCDMQ